MFGTNWSTFAVAGVQTKLDSAFFANSRTNYSDSSGLIKSIIHNQTHPRSYGHIHFD